jgi:hypothetical protein
MTYQVLSNLAGTALGPKEFLPHLVCSWTLDPASRRLSCTWAAPAERRAFSRIKARNLRPGLKLATTQA